MENNNNFLNFPNKNNQIDNFDMAVNFKNYIQKEI